MASEEVDMRTSSNETHLNTILWQQTRWLYVLAAFSHFYPPPMVLHPSQPLNIFSFFFFILHLVVAIICFVEHGGVRSAQRSAIYIKQ